MCREHGECQVAGVVAAEDGHRPYPLGVVRPVEPVEEAP